MSKVPIVGVAALMGLAVAGGIVAVDSSNKVDLEIAGESASEVPGASTLSNKGPADIIASAEDEQFRFAVAEKQCLIDEGFTEDRLDRVCASWEMRGGYVGCVRPREAPVYKCEVAREDLPAAAFKKFMGCRCAVGEDTVDWVRLVPLSWVKPVGCNCITICPSVINSKSRANVWGELEECLFEGMDFGPGIGWRDAACAPCQGTPTDWGPCPRCLAPGRDCATECVSE